MTAAGAPVRRPVAESVEYENPAPTQPYPSAKSAEDAVVYFQVLWKNRRLLSRVVLGALACSTLVAFVIPTRFESTTRLMPPDSNQATSSLAMAAAAFAGGSGGLGGMASELLGLKSSSDTFVGILSSRTVEDKLIDQFHLKDLYWDRRMEDARKDLAKRTEISVDRKSQIIEITVTDKSPQRAASMAQAYVDELNRLVAELSTSSARRERIFLEGRLQSVNKDLEDAEKSFSQFASKNTAIDIKEQGKAMVEAAATLQGQLIAAESEYQGLKQIYTDNNVRVRSVRARIDELKRELEKMGGKDESTQPASDQPSDSLYPSIRKLPILGVQYADLYRETRIQEAVLETLTKEYELAKVQEAKEIPTVKVLDAPNIPDKKSFPPRALIIILGTVLALGGALSWIFGKELWDGTHPENPRKAFVQEVFSAIRASASRFPRNGTKAESTRGNFVGTGNGNREAPKP